MSNTNNIEFTASITLTNMGIEVRDSFYSEAYFICGDCVPEIRAKFYNLIAYALDNAKVVSSDKLNPFNPVESHS
ncbi:hypothetical protein ACBZ91_17185 [Vibrio natriegens]|uniref:hypothetical protein n=1 Tax=Vibrio natriegens TaxID=691 RepID=UPI0035586E66